MVLSMERWCGKVAVVTGASAGCGAAIAEQLVEAGLQVAGLARRMDRLEQVAEKLAGKAGRFHPVQADVGKDEELLKALRWVKANLGPVSVLVNNAGISQPTTLIGGDVGMWKKVFDVNVHALNLATKVAVDDMIANNIDGHVVHVNSVLGHYVAHVPHLNVYPATKFAVTALTETIRQELNALGSKIKVTSVSPGPVDTEFATANHQGAGFDEFFAKMPKLLSEDVADAVTYVLSTPPHVHVQELMVRPVGELV